MIDSLKGIQGGIRSTADDLGAVLSNEAETDPVPVCDTIGTSPSRKERRSLAYWAEKLEDKQTEVENLEHSLSDMRT